MLEDVLAAAGQRRGHRLRILVVTPDREVAALAERTRRGHRAASRRGRQQLNAAVRRAASPLRSPRGAAQALVLPADVPLATPAELASLHRIARRPSPA